MSALKMLSALFLPVAVVHGRMYTSSAAVDAEPYTSDHTGSVGHLRAIGLPLVQQGECPNIILTHPGDDPGDVEEPGLPSAAAAEPTVESPPVQDVLSAPKKEKKKQTPEQAAEKAAWAAQKAAQKAEKAAQFNKNGKASAPKRKAGEKEPIPFANEGGREEGLG